jgi:(2Fe-2S) ferredoxin
LPEPALIDRCYVCTYLTCGDWGGKEVLAGLRERLAGTSVRVLEYRCMGFCPNGPNVVLDPGGVCYGDVQAGDVDDIVGHIQGGEPVERLHRDVDQQELRMAMWMTDADFDGGEEAC